MSVRGLGGAGERDSRWQPGPKNPGAQSSQWVPWKLGLQTQRPTRGSFWQALPSVPAALQSQSAGQVGGRRVSGPRTADLPAESPPLLTSASPYTVTRHAYKTKTQNSHEGKAEVCQDEDNCIACA